MRILFSILGDIIFFDYYSSVSRRDGTFECIIVYRELSEAQLAAKLDGTELGDRCLEVRLSEGIDRFDISYQADSNSSTATSRTLLVKTENMDCVKETIKASFANIFRILELERDLGAGLPPLTARFYLVEFETLQAATEALTSSLENFTVAEARKHMQNYTVNGSNSNSASLSNEEILIYGVPASKLLDPTIRTQATASVLATKDARPRSRSPSRHQDRSRSRDRSHRPSRDSYRSSRHHTRRDDSRSRSRSGERRRRH